MESSLSQQLQFWCVNPSRMHHAEHYSLRHIELIQHVKDHMNYQLYFAVMCLTAPRELEPGAQQWIPFAGGN